MIPIPEADISPLPSVTSKTRRTNSKYMFLPTRKRLTAEGGGGCSAEDTNKCREKETVLGKYKTVIRHSTSKMKHHLWQMPWLMDM